MGSLISAPDDMKSAVIVAVLCLIELGLSSPVASKSEQELTSPVAAHPGDPRFVFSEVSGGGNYISGQSMLLKAVISDGGAIDENDDWKQCKWTRQRDGAFCQFNYECDGIFCDIGSGNFYITTVCSAQLASRVTYQGEDPNFHNRICAMEVSYLGKDDTSLWTVDVEQCKVTGCGSDNGNGFIISESVNVIVN